MLTDEEILALARRLTRDDEFRRACEDPDATDEELELARAEHERCVSWVVERIRKQRRREQLARARAPRGMRFFFSWLPDA